VEIDVSHGPSYGRTICDLRHVTGEPATANVGVAIDVDAFYDLLIGTLATY
jgi:inosine-uridine nucleoside N-ribohydrolase